MSIVRREQDSGTGGTAYTFLKPMPAARGGRTEPLNLSVVTVDEAVSALFPPRDQGDSSKATGVSLGPYRILEQIGRGGMGAVFRATDIRLDRIVALKVLSPELSRDSSAVQRFQNEGRAAARLDHDNIAQVHDVGHDHGLFYIAFEFVAGTNLRDLLNRHNGPFSPAAAVSITLQVADALRQTAAADVVHRDIKPSNIIISPGGRAKLVDWGLARQNSQELSQELTQTGTTLGTFDYISPEQAVDPRNVDVRSDIYSLGCTLFHMLTGEPPYPRGSMFQKVVDHHRPEPPDPAQRNPSVSAELSRINRRMMASDPLQRYASPEAVIHDLSAVGAELGVIQGEGAAWAVAPSGRLESASGPRAGFGWLGAFVALILLVWYLDQPRNPEGPDSQTPQGAFDGELAANSKGTDGAAGGSSPSRSRVAPDRPSSSNRRGGIRLGMPLPSRQFVAAQSQQDLSSANRDIAAAAGTDSTQLPMTPPGGVSTAKFRVRSGSGNSDKVYQSLETACAEAADRDAIELLFSGRLSLEDPIRITGKRLTIRAAPNFRPVLELRLSETEAQAGSRRFPRMITVTGAGGALEMSNVDLVLKIPSDSITERWAMFAVTPGQSVSLRNVSVTVDNPSRQAASIFEIGALGASNMTRGPTDPPVQRADLLIDSCLLRGRANCIWHESSDLASVRIVQSALALNGAFYWRSAADALTDVLAQRDNLNEIDIDHVTGVFESNLLNVDLGDQGETRPFRVTCRDSVIVIADSRTPLVAMSGHGDVDKYVDLLEWTGSFCYYEVGSAFWEIKARNAQGQASKSWPFPEWKTKWGNDLDSLVSAPLFERFPRTGRRDYQGVTTDDFALLQNGVTTNPPVRGDSTGKNAGANLTLLPKNLPAVPRSESAFRDRLYQSN